MVRNVKLYKRLMAGVIAITLIKSGICGYQIKKSNDEIRRVKGYLSEFVTNDNYVDLSKISSSYNIENFSGKALRKALSDTDIDYVRITDSYIYDKAHVEGFVQKNAVNKDVILGIDDEGNVVYECYEPIRYPGTSGVNYSVLDGFELEDIKVYAEPIRYHELDDKEVVVFKNDYEDSYSLSLEKKK